MSHRPTLLSIALIAAPLVVLSCRSSAPSRNTAESVTGRESSPEDGPGGSTAIHTVTHRQQRSGERPASLVRWEGERPTLQVLFATNRIPQRPSPGSRWSYDRQFDQTLRFGLCHVTLSEQRRGNPPEPDTPPPRLLGFIPLPQEPPPPPPPAPEVTLVQPLAGIEFHDRLKQMLAESATPELLLFVHGFNMDLDTSSIRAAQVALDMPFEGAVICYSWPSRDSEKARSTDSQIVEQSGLPLARLLVALLDEVPETTRVHIVAHCMGNRALLEALNKLPDRFEEPRRIDNIVHAAPDVSVNEFRELAPRGTRLANRVTLYVCESDPALAGSPASADAPRAGNARPPLVIPGIETIDTDCVSTGPLGEAHDVVELGLLGDLSALIREGRPASQRPWLDLAESNAGVWWICRRKPEEEVWSWPRAAKQTAEAPRTPEPAESPIRLLSAPGNSEE
ncbi:Alpha/beta hydrolase family protein [Maioricimonas rarisocia]|uniref:Alpha/beta hydrolase family protein n=1 Tax=Maioricimonas rarisocia TaxID=2528026 RepID=A0A517Z2E6_9PLAN|nr:alpha/beta hydrolase [Maioricimonas rarisocia]QDU36654.1 Alpha/beta hydrolase family protein [Maioricimonas rarisocia]